MIIPKEICENIFNQAKSDAPIEACGFLLGMSDRVTKHIPMTNADAREDRFSFVPEEQLTVYREVNKTGILIPGIMIIGIYHSHPSAPAWPSSEDIRLAYDPDIVYVIVSLIQGMDIRAFNITEGIVTELSLTIGS